MIGFGSKELILNSKASFEPITFSATGAMQTWQVPAGIKQIHVDCVACQGGNGGGLGGRVECDLTVKPKQILNIMVGKVPGNIETAVYNAADIRIGGTEYANRVIVAGGGGSKASSGATGGAGGGLTGGNGASSDASKAAVGTGGTQNSGGNGGSSGTLGKGGNGKYVPAQKSASEQTSGAGGAGYYGGGGGNAVNKASMGNTYSASAGGGGEGAGYVKISMIE